MAYGIKYKAEWLATTRKERLYTLQILQKEYTGAVLPMNLTGDCICITYGAVDQSELTPTKTSEAEISILCTEDGEPYTEFFTLDAEEYKVEIYENGDMAWTGYISTGEYQQPLARPPYQVHIRANDGLGILQTKPYLDADGNKYMGNCTISNLIRKLLSPISENVDIWNYDMVNGNQKAPTFDVLAIPESVLYEKYTDNVPTHYDVLIDVLSSFGVQLTQQRGVWRVRSMASLLTAVNSNILPSITVDVPSSEFYGVSSSAVLSFLPALRKLTIAKDGERQKSLNTQLFDTNAWITNILQDSGDSDPDSYKLKIVSYSSVDAISCVKPNYQAYRGIYYFAIATLPYTFHRSTSRAKFNFTLHSPSEKYFNVGIWLYDSNFQGNILDAVRRYDSGSKSYRAYLRFNTPVACWDNDNGKWIINYLEKDARDVSLGLTRVALVGAGTGSVAKIIERGGTNVTITLNNIPSLQFDTSVNEYCNDWKVAIVLAPEENGGITLISNIEMVEESSMQANDVEISNRGTIDESYDPTYILASPPTLAPFRPGVIDLERNGKTVYGYFTAIGHEGKDVIGAMLLNLRNRTTRTIEGEIDTPFTYGVDNIYTLDGKKYYTSYVRHILKRRVSSVQMRECTSLNDINGSISFGLGKAPLQNPIALADKLYYTTFNSNLCMLDINTMSVTVLATLRKSQTYQPIVSKGIGCVVVKEAVSLSDISVTAYGATGDVIAKLEDFTESDLGAESWYRTALYDAVREIWLVDNGAGKVVSYSKDGTKLSTWNISATSIQDTEILPYDGGFVYRVHTASGYTSYWHSYDFHAGGEFEKGVYPIKSSNVIAINSRFIVSELSDGRTSVYVRNSSDITEISGTTKYLAAGNEVIAMNDGLILTRGSGGAAIYDFRSSPPKYKNISLGDQSSLMALCQDKVFVQAPTITSAFDWKRIIPTINNLTTTEDELL